MARPTLAIRVSPEVYNEVFEIAESRDVSMSEALDMLLFRLRKGQSGKESERTTGKRRGKGGEGRKRARKAKTVGEQVGKAIDEFDNFFK